MNKKAITVDVSVGDEEVQALTELVRMTEHYAVESIRKITRNLSRLQKDVYLLDDLYPGLYNAERALRAVIVDNFGNSDRLMKESSTEQYVFLSRYDFMSAQLQLVVDALYDLRGQFEKALDIDEREDTEHGD